MLIALRASLAAAPGRSDPEIAVVIGLYNPLLEAQPEDRPCGKTRPLRNEHVQESDASEPDRANPREVRRIDGRAQTGIAEQRDVLTVLLREIRPRARFDLL